MLQAELRITGTVRAVLRYQRHMHDRTRKQNGVDRNLPLEGTIGLNQTHNSVVVKRAYVT